MKRSIVLGLLLSVVGCGDSIKHESSSGSAAKASQDKAKVATIIQGNLDDAKRLLADQVSLSLKNFDELQTLIASKKGKIVVVDAWSTYCEPCMKEFPGLVGLHTKYGPEKVACISLCANYTGVGDLKEESAEPLKFLQKQGATFDNVFSTDGDEKLYQKLKIASVPTIFVYDRDGKLLKVFDGEPKYADVEALVATLIK
jgi:thiol-disulfide isomerase/thioredoxin